MRTLRAYLKALCIRSFPSTAFCTVGRDPMARRRRKSISTNRRSHDHWHSDIAYLKIGGIFYFLIMALDGYSRYLLGWELMTDMLGSSVENFIARVKEKYPHARPKLIHDNGSQFISHDFKKLMTTLEIQSERTAQSSPDQRQDGADERHRQKRGHQAQRSDPLPRGLRRHERVWIHLQPPTPARRYRLPAPSRPIFWKADKSARRTRRENQTGAVDPAADKQKCDGAWCFDSVLKMSEGKKARHQAYRGYLHHQQRAARWPDEY